MSNPLFDAIQAHEPDLIARLVAEGANPNAIDPAGHSALWSACASGDVGCARALLECGADPNLRLNIHSITFGLETGVCVLMYALKPEIARLLIEHGADINARDDKEMTALMRAAHFGKLEVLETLLEHGADAANGLELAQRRLEFWRSAAGQKGFKQEVVPQQIARYEKIVERLMRAGATTASQRH